MKLDHILFRTTSEGYDFSCAGNDLAELPSRINHNGNISYSDHEAVGVEFVVKERKNQFRSEEVKMHNCNFMEKLLPMVTEDEERSRKGYRFWRTFCVAGAMAQFAWARLSGWADISSGKSCLLSCGLGAFTFYSLVGCCSNYQRANRLESKIHELKLNMYRFDRRKIA